MSQIKSKRFWAALLSAGTFAALWGTAGCGSGGHTTPSHGTAFITRADDPTLSDDAKILATRQATGAFVPLDAARVFDADLAKIRAAYFGVRGVHARPTNEPKTMLVIVKPTASWIGKWNASLATPTTNTDTDLTTGEPALDALLGKYAATRTTDAYDFATGRYYMLRFGESLNMNAVAYEFLQSSTNIVSATANGLIGDGDDIFYTPASGAKAKAYTFSQGYGDCPGGCINRFDRTFTLQSDGSFSETVVGTAPPAMVQTLPGSQARVP